MQDRKAVQALNHIYHIIIQAHNAAIRNTQGGEYLPFYQIFDWGDEAVVSKDDRGTFVTLWRGGLDISVPIAVPFEVEGEPTYTRETITRRMYWLLREHGLDVTSSRGYVVFPKIHRSGPSMTEKAFNLRAAPDKHSDTL